MGEVKMDPLNILVVEDSLVVREVVKKTLRLSGLPLGTVYTCANGKEGVEFLNTSPLPIHLIITDINMPVMDGCEMLYMVSDIRKFRGIPVIVISAESNKDRQCGSGNVKFLQKPFSPEILRDTVIGLLGG